MTQKRDAGSSLLWRIRKLMQTWAARKFERKYLATLKGSQLREMHELGLTMDDVRQLASRPFWRK